MKKYFVDWCQVEGEIENGDSVKFNATSDVEHNITVDETSIYNSKGKLLYDKKGTLRVKLCLCSKEDFEVGDIVQPLDYCLKPTTIVEKDYTGVWNCANGDWYESHEIMRIIGIISPDATNVKQGDEFDENQIRKGGHAHHKIIPKINLETRTYWGDRVKLLSDTPSGFDGTIPCEYLDEAELNHHSSCRKGETYNYHLNSLGYSKLYTYKIQCSSCKHFH